MEFYGITDIGKKRAVNEDTFEARKICDNAAFLVVCDGMGGEAGGAAVRARSANGAGAPPGIFPNAAPGVPPP